MIYAVLILSLKNITYITHIISFSLYNIAKKIKLNKYELKFVRSVTSCYSHERI